jgi:ATP-dependent Lon protease
MEVIEIPGYTFREKHHIAREHLLPRQIDAHGIADEHIELTDDALHEVINRYTREAGVRNLERRLADICRGVAVKVAEAIDASLGGNGKAGSAEIATGGNGNGHTTGEHLAVTEISPPTERPTPTTEPNGAAHQPFERVVVTPENLDDFLGAERFSYDVAERVSAPGVATGLAWTAAGGDILFIESTKMPGKGELLLTGQLGDVMKESARAALSFIRSRTGEYGVQPAIFRENDIHIHVPAGAIPKDGPSAGITLFASLLSLVTGRQVRDDIAMTGEITLRGSILPIGGIKEKVLAAHRAHIRRVILPARNEKDMGDVSDDIKQEMEFHFVSNMAELPPLVLLEPPTRDETQAPAEASV